MIELLRKSIERYYELGYTVFPLEIQLVRGKKKIIKCYEWEKKLVNKEIALKILETRHNTIALLTGKKYNAFVIDLDTKPDPKNELEEKLIQYSVNFYNVPMVSTLHGGAHYYFSFPSGLQGATTRESVIHNLDIRGDGGLVFAPPTEINGLKYTWKIKLNGKLPELPESLKKLINDNSKESYKFKNVPKVCEYLKTINLGYDLWYKCGMALSEMGEDGREYFHLISDNEFYNDPPEKINGKFDNFLETTQEIKIGTLFSIAFQNGFTLEKNTFDDDEPEIPEVIFFSRDALSAALCKQAKMTEADSFSLGWPEIDQYLKLIKPQLTIITGMPYSGKSNFMDAIAVNMSKLYDWHFCVFSPESMPLNEHIESLSNKYSGFPLRPGKSLSLEESEYQEVIDFIDSHFFIMNTNIVNRNLDNILKLIEIKNSEIKVDAFILDPWNELEHARPSYKSETEYIGYTLGRIKAFCLQFDIHVFIVVHPTKVFPEKEGGKRVVKPYDISGSANWFNKADNIISVYRDFCTDEVEIYIQKVKRRRLGKLGKIPMDYKITTGEYLINFNPINSQYKEER